MQIKRYVGPELPQVLAQINRELGPYAAIINTRKIHQGGFLGLMGKPMVEVTVAVDYNFKLSDDNNGRTPSGGPGQGPGRAARAGRRHAPPPEPEASRPRSFFTSVDQSEVFSSPPRREEPAEDMAPRESPFREAPRFEPRPEDLRRSAGRELSEMRVTPRGGAPRAESPFGSLSADLERVHRALLRNGVEDYLSRRILMTFEEQMSLLGEDWPKAQARLERYLAGLIRTSPGIEIREGRKPVVAAFIGPTGVGKTTTIAKIASHFALAEHRRVAIVTLDTYRMAATDQIRRYGDILGIPVEVADSPEEVEQVMLRLTGHDLVLVDTAGRSPQNKDQIMQMKKAIEAARPDEVHLVVSMTTKYIDVLSIVARFGIVPVNRLVLTKFDETRQYGLLLNLSVNFSMNISYLANGQQVPDDLEMADPARLARMVLAGVGDGRAGGPA
jgi:flagellar biosynthesis protein FlhF